LSDTRFLSLALSLGRRGMGRTWPNPSVGCVIVKNNQIIGRGTTADGGRPHAEVVALGQAGENAHGATAYVTLEPCAHAGKSPPCSDALIKSGIARVVAAVSDHDPRVDGKGFSALKAAGIDVVTGVMADEATRDHSGFFLSLSEKRPFVTLKMATSFDGRIATVNGQSKWITDVPARRLVHVMRSRHDAVMVGGGTARLDDPSLNVRNLGIDHQPVRVVVSRNLDLPDNSILARTAQQTPLWICHGQDAKSAQIQKWQNVGAKLIACDSKDGMLNLNDAMAGLTSLGLTRIFCEGGGALAASLIKSDLVDALIGFGAGVLIGSEGQPCIGALGLDDLKSAKRWDLEDLQKLGPDIIHKWRRRSLG
jgi:diaminohydroxyphosphoribosylaminopyrimidine deaminase/5-amino-6-(5-phosphoribosylamino)uracil reductase